MAVKAGEPSLEEVLGDTPEKLNQPCRDEHLCEVARHITDWPALAPLMGIQAQEMEEIRGKWPFSIGGQRMEFLRKWKDKRGRKGTYRRLCKAFLKAGETTLAEKVCDILRQPRSDSESSSEESEEEQPSQSSQSSDPKPKAKQVETPPLQHGAMLPSPIWCTNVDSLDSLAAYLRMTYGSQTPNFVVFQWPPPPTLKVFNLAMIRSHEIVRRSPLDEELVRLTLRGNVDDIMEKKTSIKLQDLFKRYHRIKDRKIVLIEGAPGAGKSTLAWDICLRWKSRELFLQEFRVVIYVQLRDLEVQLAKDIADLLPMELDSQQQNAASLIKSCYGQGVLFVLDGWDEYSPGLQQNSLFETLLCHPEKCSVQLSTILITSRPIASGKLQPYATSRVEIVGFTPDEVCKYFNDVFKDPLTVQKLYDQLKDRPTIKASCYLPLNAAIVAHLFIELDHILPTTLHGVFTSLVLSCIIRHMTKHSGTEPKITSLEDLPPNEKEVFQKVCIVAYEGAVSNKVIFSSQDLRSYGLPEDLNALSLMQVVQSFATGKPTSYHFLHLSIQELLAALHISKLPPPEQVRIFNDLFGQPRFEAVFRLYAAFTKLQVEGIKEIVAKVVQGDRRMVDLSRGRMVDLPRGRMVNLSRGGMVDRAMYQNTHVRTLLNLMHCLYEAQDVSLCLFVSSHLNGILDLCSTPSLSPFDFLSFNYFLSCVNSSSPGPAAGSESVSSDVPLVVYLTNWHFTGQEYVIRSLRNLMRVVVVAANCTCAADLLTNNPQLKVLKLFCPRDGGNSDGESFAAALREHLSLEFLQFDAVFSIRTSPILKALRNHHSLKRLHLNRCLVDMKEVAAILEVNKSLQELLFNDTVISDRSLATLANSLKKNSTLEKLGIVVAGASFSIDSITADGVREFVWSLRDCQLKIFATNKYVDAMHGLSDQVNEVRTQQGLPPLHVRLIAPDDEF